ncbi:cell adhesion molecule CEACAM21-like isoform X3 [Dendrobates tinctorius]|uniref:cell adhesion molecule CEACAM21-like isoform X3 n=1 Tax=Dendrobates tinctorius TaxID=92724 RepID=UPI003CCA30D2
MRRFLITVLLILKMDVTSGQISILAIPQYLVISGSVTLNLTVTTEELEHVSWYKGPDKTPQYLILTYFPGNSPPILVPGLLYNDRISAFKNGSLHIKDLRVTDRGNYIAQIQMVSSAKDIVVTLTIYDPVTKPKIIASIKQPKESDPFTLTCNTSNDTTISWTKKAANISSETKLSEDNRTLMFSSIKREDSGEYRCEAQNIASNDVSDPYTVTVVLLICEEPTGLILGLVFGLILSVVLHIISCFYLQRKLTNRRNETKTSENRHNYNNFYVNNMTVFQVSSSSQQRVLQMGTRALMQSQQEELSGEDVGSVRELST